MARERMVTRTVEVVQGTYLGVDILTTQSYQEEFTLSGVEPDNDRVLKVLKKTYETTTSKVVAIVNMEVHEYCYGMKEEEFIKLATPLDPTTRKRIEDETA